MLNVLWHGQWYRYHPLGDGALAWVMCLSLKFVQLPIPEISIAHINKFNKSGFWRISPKRFFNIFE